MTSRLPVSAPAWHAELHLRFTRAGARSVLRDNRHQGPLRVQKALYPEGEAVCQAIVLHPPSGIAGGDHLHICASVEAGAHAQLTTPGAGKWYRSGGADASQTLDLQVADGACLEWLPQEAIVFDGARARMDTRIELAADSRLMAWDILCLGRAAAGERFGSGRVDLACRIERAGSPIWIERGGFDGGDALLASPAGSADALSETDQQTVRELFLVGGSSFNFQKASAEESRRIELRLEFRDLGERAPALRPRLQEGDSRCPLDAP